MNSRERIVAALQGRKSDKRGLGLTLSLYGAKVTGCPVEQYFSDAEAYEKGQAAVLDRFRSDILFGPFAFALFGEAFGSRICYREGRPPILSEPVKPDSPSLRRLDMPALESHPNLIFLRDSLRHVVQRHGSDVPVGAILLSPTDFPAMVLGVEEWLGIALFEESARERILDVSVSFFVEWAKRMQAEGADLLVLPMVFTNPAILPREWVARIGIPCLKEALAQISGPVILHSGGLPMQPFLDLFADLPGVAGYCLNEGESFSEARNQIGSDPVLLGGIGIVRLSAMSPPAVQSECRRILRDRAEDPRFIYATTGADISWNTPEETVLALREAVDAFCS